MITDVDESDIIGTRCFTDLTVPLNVDADQNILKNIMHSIKEIVYHTFDNKTVYIFAILQSGNIQVFKQINRYDGGTKIRFKKVLIPDLIGKKVNIDLQEYSVKDKDLLSLKRQRSNTISYLDGTKEYQRITCTQIRVMENNMIYIKDLGVVIHEMKGNIFSYSLTNNRNWAFDYKAIESWDCSYTGQSAFIVSDSFKSVKVMVPQKEFNFGTKKQIYSDLPQIRTDRPEFGVLKKIAVFRTLKYEEFVILGWFKQTENFKEIEIPAPLDNDSEAKKLSETSESHVESSQQQSYLLEKPGFATLKPIIPVSKTNLIICRKRRIKDQMHWVSKSKKIQD